MPRGLSKKTRKLSDKQWKLCIKEFERRDDFEVWTYNSGAWFYPKGKIKKGTMNNLKIDIRRDSWTGIITLDFPRLEHIRYPEFEDNNSEELIKKDDKWPDDIGNKVIKSNAIEKINEIINKILEDYDEYNINSLSQKDLQKMKTRKEKREKRRIQLLRKIKK